MWLNDEKWIVMSMATIEIQFSTFRQRHQCNSLEELINNEQYSNIENIL